MDIFEGFKLRAFYNLRRAQWNFLGWRTAPASSALDNQIPGPDPHWLGIHIGTHTLNNESSRAGRIHGTIDPATNGEQKERETVTVNTDPRCSGRAAYVAQCQTPKSFPRFADLPAEIRIKIWILNLPAPRYLTLHQEFLSDDFHGQRALSPLFDACFESNAVIALAYPLCFEIQLSGNGLRFSPDRDTIIFPDYRIMKDFSPQSWFGYAKLSPTEEQGYKLVKHLIVRYDFLLGVVLPFVERFENLETLVVEGMIPVHPTWRNLAVDEQSFMARLRVLTLKRGTYNMPLVTFLIGR